MILSNEQRQELCDLMYFELTRKNRREDPMQDAFESARRVEDWLERSEKKKAADTKANK